MNVLSWKRFKNISFTSAISLKKSLFLTSSIILAFSGLPAYGFQLNLSGAVTGDLTTSDPNDTNIGGTMRFAEVDPDDSIDLVITTLSDYLPRNPSNNGSFSTNDARINMPRDSFTNFRFSFVQTGTTNPVVSNEAEIGFYDIDGQSRDNSRERIILYSTGQYTVSETSQLVFEQVNGGRIQFTSPATAINNPANSSSLAATEENYSIKFTFNNVSEFDIGYEIVGGNSALNRNFFFTGDVVFDDTNPVTESFTAVPFEFSPGLGLLLSGGCLFGIKPLKRCQLQK